MLIDFWLNRKWLIKMGRKFCIGSETKMQFKKIKASKKAMKAASANLAYVKLQLNHADKDQKKLLKE